MCRAPARRDAEPGRSACRATCSTPTAAVPWCRVASPTTSRSGRCSGCSREYPGAIFQTITRDDTLRAHVHALAYAAGVRVLVARRRHGQGRATANPASPTWVVADAPTQPRLGFESSIGTAAVPAWHELVNGPADRKTRPARRPGVAGPGPPRLGPPARRAELVPGRAAPRADPERPRRRGPGPAASRCATWPTRGRAPVRRARRLGARERHRLALHQAQRRPDDLRGARGPGSGVLRPVRHDLRGHRRRRAPQDVLRRWVEPLPAHPLGPRHGDAERRAGRALPHQAQHRLLLAARPGRGRGGPAGATSTSSRSTRSSSATSSGCTTCPTATTASPGPARASGPRSSAGVPTVLEGTPTGERPAVAQQRTHGRGRILIRLPQDQPGRPRPGSSRRRCTARRRRCAERGSPHRSPRRCPRARGPRRCRQVGGRPSAPGGTMRTATPSCGPSRPRPAPRPPS